MNKSADNRLNNIIIFFLGMNRLANILFVWERGGGTGHLVSHLQLIQSLMARNHRVLFVVKQTATAARILNPIGCPFIQSPPAGVRLPLEQRMWPLHSLHQMLFNIGFHDPQQTAGRIQAWRKIYADFKPDILFSDFSPTALLASQGLEMARVAVGYGFLFPPEEGYRHPMRFWGSSDPERLKKDEGRLLAVINQALDRVGTAPVDNLRPLTHGQMNLIQSFPVLDPHDPRRGGDERYQLYLPEDVSGVAPVWPEGEGKKIFAYLKPTEWGLTMLKVLKASGLSTLVFAPSIPEPYRRQMASSSLRFSTAPLNMSQVTALCDLAVSEAGHGMTLQMMAAGRPMLMGISHIEQAINAEKVKQAGMGLFWPSGEKGGGELPGRMIERLLSEDSFRQAAEALGRSVKADQGLWIAPEALAEQIEGLL
ncbi:MAG: hypothetical protein HQL67_03955 [Magnetococcales bacterium]|nr:hypothetical protein [Magnetococcales bacterium]